MLLKAGDADVKEAFEGGGGGDEEGGWAGLEGNVEGFRKDEDVWRDFELQAAAAVVYAGLLEGEEVLEKAREVLCKVSGRGMEGGEIKKGRC
jgi:SET and MYND domain-containing protein